MGEFMANVGQSDTAARIGSMKGMLSEGIALKLTSEAEFANGQTTSAVRSGNSAMMEFLQVMATAAVLQAELAAFKADSTIYAGRELDGD